MPMTTSFSFEQYAKSRCPCQVQFGQMYLSRFTAFLKAADWLPVI